MHVSVLQPKVARDPVWACILRVLREALHRAIWDIDHSLPEKDTCCFTFFFLLYALFTSEVPDRWLCPVHDCSYLVNTP